jgi:hypothetical protein
VLKFEAGVLLQAPNIEVRTPSQYRVRIQLAEVIDRPFSETVTEIRMKLLLVTTVLKFDWLTHCTTTDWLKADRLVRAVPSDPTGGEKVTPLRPLRLSTGINAVRSRICSMRNSAVDRSAPAPLAIVKELLATTIAVMDKPTSTIEIRTSSSEKPLADLGCLILDV